MPDPKLASPQPIAPMTVAVITGTGDGAQIPSGTEFQTPDHQPNVVVMVVTPIVAILIRAVNVFLNTLLGGMGLVGVSSLTAMPTLAWASWKVAIVFAASAALVNVLQTCATIFGKLENKFPLMTGNV